MHTWDGQPVSELKPHGVTVIVYRYNRSRVEFLILHRSYYGSDYAGEWAWTPPSGARLPGESVDDCAKRELYEETGLRMNLVPSGFGTEDWAVFVALCRPTDRIDLSPEHDRYAWVDYEILCQRCQPEIVMEPFRKFMHGLEASHGSKK